MTVDSNTIELTHLEDDGWTASTTGYRDLYLIATARVASHCGVAFASPERILFCKQKLVGRTEYLLDEDGYVRECNSTVDCTKWNNLELDEDSTQYGNSTDYPYVTQLSSENCNSSGVSVTVRAVESHWGWEDYFPYQAVSYEQNLTAAGTTDFGSPDVLSVIFEDENYTGMFNQDYKVNSVPGAIEIEISGIINNPNFSSYCTDCLDLNGSHILKSPSITNTVSYPVSVRWDSAFFGDGDESATSPADYLAASRACCQPTNYCGPATGFMCANAMSFTIASGTDTRTRATFRITGSDSQTPTYDVFTASGDITSQLPLDGRSFTVTLDGDFTGYRQMCLTSGLSITIKSYTELEPRISVPCITPPTPCEVFKDTTPPASFLVDIPNAWTEFNNYNTTGSGGGPYIPSCQQRGDTVIKPVGSYILNRLGGHNLGEAYNTVLEYGANSCPSNFAWDSPPNWAEGCVYGYINPVSNTGTPCHGNLIRNDCVTGPIYPACGQGLVNTCGWNYMTLSFARYSHAQNMLQPCQPYMIGEGTPCDDGIWDGVFGIFLKIYQTSSVPGGACFESVTDNWDSSYSFMALISGSHPAVVRSEGYAYIDPSLLGDVELWYSQGNISNQSTLWDGAPIDVTGPCGYQGCYNPDTGNTCGYYNCFPAQGSVCECRTFVNTDLSPSSPYQKITLSVI